MIVAVGRRSAVFQARTGEGVFHAVVLEVDVRYGRLCTVESLVFADVLPLSVASVTSEKLAAISQLDPVVCTRVQLPLLSSSAIFFRSLVVVDTC